MAVLLAGISAVIYGVADFAGGFAARRNDGPVVAVRSQSFGVLVLIVLLVLWPDVTVHRSDVLWGLVGGLGAGVGLRFFYPALAAGPMSVVAPLTSVVGASVPLMSGLLLGDSIGWTAGTGVVLALPAIVATAAAPEASAVRASRVTILRALLAGCGFGTMFVCMSRTHAAAGLWPLAAARVGSLTLMTAPLLVRRTSLRLTPGSFRVVMVAGVCDLAANALYLLAATRGVLSVVAVLGSMYPVSTVLLAVVWLRERLAPRQVVGVAAAAVAVGLIAAG